ncbi:MAG: trypsin-like peptidase domain-containing protein [Methylotenera sp.]
MTHIIKTLKFSFMLLLAAVAQSAVAKPPPEMVYNLKGTIVKIYTVTKSGGRGTGSGFVVADNLVATNCHVLTNATGISMSSRGESYAPVGLRADWRHDVCLLRFEYLQIKPAALAETDELHYGADTFSVGFSGGSPKPLTTVGKIKALYAFDDGYVIRTSASFLMGASGSPLLNEKGEVIGMNTFKSPGANGYFYNVPVKWIQAAMTLPETDKVVQTETPFWDMPLEQRPYWMQVVLPTQAGKWDDLLVVAKAWQQSAPKDPEANYYVGLAHQNLGLSEQSQEKIQMAKTIFEQVLKLQPEHTPSLLALAQMAQSKGNQPEFKSLSQQLSVLDEDAFETLNNPAQQ